MRKNSWQAFLVTALLLSGCEHVQIPNTKSCTVAGIITDGAICAESITHQTSDMTMEEFVVFLEPQEAAGGAVARAGAICRSAADEAAIHNTLEKLCRMAKDKCSYDMKRAIGIK